MDIEISKRYKFLIDNSSVGFSEYNDKSVTVRLWNIDSNNFVIGTLIICTVEGLEPLDDVVFLYVKDVEYL